MASAALEALRSNIDLAFLNARDYAQKTLGKLTINQVTTLEARQAIQQSFVGNCQADLDDVKRRAGGKFSSQADALLHRELSGKLASARRWLQMKPRHVIVQPPGAEPWKPGDEIRDTVPPPAPISPTRMRPVVPTQPGLGKVRSRVPTLPGLGKVRSRAPTLPGLGGPGYGAPQPGSKPPPMREAEAEALHEAVGTLDGEGDALSWNQIKERAGRAAAIVGMVTRLGGGHLPDEAAVIRDDGTFIEGVRRRQRDRDVQPSSHGGSVATGPGGDDHEAPPDSLEMPEDFAGPSSDEVDGEIVEWLNAGLAAARRRHRDNPPAAMRSTPPPSEPVTQRWDPPIPLVRREPMQARGDGAPLPCVAGSPARRRRKPAGTSPCAGQAHMPWLSRPPRRGRRGGASGRQRRPRSRRRSTGSSIRSCSRHSRPSIPAAWTRPSCGPASLPTLCDASRRSSRGW